MQEAPEAASLLAFCQGDAMLLLLAPVRIMLPWQAWLLLWEGG